MPIAAGVVGYDAMRAVITLLDVAAQCGGATGADVVEGFALPGRDNMSPLPEEFRSVFTNDIGQFEPMFGHRLRPSPSEIHRSRIGNSSKGLCVACTLRTETWR